MSDANFSRQNQVVIDEISIYEPDVDGNAPPRTEWMSLAPMVQEVNLYEDIFSSQISAQMLIADSVNLPDQFPIEPGCRVFLKFKTTDFTGFIEQDLAVYKIGERIFEQDEAKAQMYWLHLCSPEKYLDVQLDLSYYHKGNRTALVKKAMGDLKTKKVLDFEESIGVFDFVCPSWSPLTTSTWAASRATSPNGGPFFFWEGLGNFSFRSLEAIYQQEPIKRIFFEPRNNAAWANDPDKLLNTVRRWEYHDSLDLLRLHSRGVFGVVESHLNPSTWNHERVETTPKMTNQVHLEKNPLVVIWSNPQKVDFRLAQPDGSEVNAARRTSIIERLRNYKILVNIQGDSDLRAGMIVEADIPSSASDSDYTSEKYSSGKWLISSIRHIITRDRYRQNVEIIKDSTAQMIL